MLILFLIYFLINSFSLFIHNFINIRTMLLIQKFTEDYLQQILSGSKKVENS